MMKVAPDREGKWQTQAQSSTSSDRLRAALPDAAAATVAAALSWLLARALFGHPHPVFAAVTAIVCLAPGLPNHGRQAVGLVLGVATGIVVGEAALLAPDICRRCGSVVATFLAIMVASSYGLQPVVPIQAGVSALLVWRSAPLPPGPCGCSTLPAAPRSASCSARCCSPPTR